MQTLPSRAVLLTAAAFSLLAGSVLGDDWPQWRGPRQDGISAETSLLSQWPEKGPAELWRVPLGSGFSAVSVVGDRLYTLYGAGDGEFALAASVADGKTFWKTRLGDLLKSDSYGDGPRATPTVEAGRLFALSGKGALRCLDASDGRLLWGCDLLEKFGGQPPEYGFGASPVVLGDMLVVETGAKQGKTLVAFDKTSGKVLWTALDDRIGYSTPVETTIDGMREIIVLTGQAVVGLSPRDGKEYWRYPWSTELDANVATPVVSGKRLFISTGYSTGCAVFELRVKDGRPTAERLWANKEMKNYLSTSVLVNGYLYGFNNNKLTCLDFRTGKTRWKTGGFNRGSLIAADGKLILYGDTGLLALAEISPAAYKELSQFKVCDERTWTVPTLSGGRLFLRNEKELACFKMGE